MSEESAMGDVTVAVCRKCNEHACLARILSDREGVVVELVRCQKICHGPVAGLAVDGRMQWFEKVDGVKQIAALVRLTRRQPDGRIPKPLRRRRVPKRAGKLRD
jgi:hypothetical protein